MRWWHGRPAELSHRTATWCVAAYLAFFPVDALLLSRLSVGNSSNPPLFAALLAAVHFLIFVNIVRFYSAVTDRDALFLSMLSFAVFSPRPFSPSITHLPDSFFHLSPVRCFHFCWHGTAPRSSRRGFARPACPHRARSKIESRAESLRSQRGRRIHRSRWRAVFLFPAYQRRVPRPRQLQHIAHVRFHGKRRARSNRRNQKEFRGGHARTNRQADFLRAAALEGHRATTFDGRRWSSS